MQALNLLYHRVNVLSPDPWTLCVSPAHFAEQLDVVSRLSPPPVITFDDGYADNLLQALPILEKFDLPAHFFIASGKLGAEEEWWWDALDQLFKFPSAGPNNYWDTYTHLRSLSSSLREQQLNRLFEEASRKRVLRADRRMMTPNELSRLAASTLAEIGAHTISHPVLASLNLEEQSAEVNGSKRQVEEIIGKTLTCFAYPNGMEEDFTLETIDIVKRAGFNSAYSAFEHERNDQFQQPRVMIRDWNGEEFEKVLRTASNPPK